MKFNTIEDATEFVEVYLSHHGETDEVTNPDMVKNLVKVGIPCEVYDGSDIAALQGDNLYRLDDYLYNTLADWSIKKSLVDQVADGEITAINAFEIAQRRALGGDRMGRV